MGVEVEDAVVEASTDSSAAKSYASRRGTGRVRHVEVKQLWLQQAVAEGRFRLSKVLGTENPADVMTKYKPLQEMRRMLAKVNVDVVEKSGRREEDGDPALGWLRLGPGEMWGDAAVEE